MADEDLLKLRGLELFISDYVGVLPQEVQLNPEVQVTLRAMEKKNRSLSRLLNARLCRNAK